MKNIMEDNKSGFTIVELTLTMAFIGMLLIAIAVITTNILAIYQKGTTLKAVNNTGRDLIDSFSNAVTNAPSLNVKSSCAKFANSQDCENNDGFMGFTFNEGRDTDGNQLYGVFCTGSYSYAWNTEYTLRNDNPGQKWLSLRYNDASGHEQTKGASRNEMFRLIRIEDSTRRICSATVNTDYESNFPTSTIIDARKYLDSDDSPLLLDDSEIKSDLLVSSDIDLVLYELTVFPYSHDDITGHNLYAGTFTLGTRRGDIDIQSSSDFCKNSSKTLYGDESETAGSTGNLGAEFNYCAINKFNFAARSAGE